LVPEVKELSSSDLKIVQGIVVTGEPLDLLPGAVTVLGERGDIADAYLLKSFVLNQALPNSPLTTTAKFAAISAIGRIGGRLNSQAVLAELIPFTAPLGAEQAVGPSHSQSLRLQAVLGLGQGKEAAKPLIESLQAREEASRTGKALDLKSIAPNTNGAVLNAIQQAAPIEPAWLNRAKEIAASPQ
jgi:hypothetical protein